MAYISCKETASNLLFCFHEKWHAHVRDMISKDLSLRGEWGEGYLSEVFKDTSNIPGSVCANVFALTNSKREQLLQYGAVTSNIFPLCISELKFPLVHNRKFDTKIFFV